MGQKTAKPTDQCNNRINNDIGTSARTCHRAHKTTGLEVVSGREGRALVYSPGAALAGEMALARHTLEKSAKVAKMFTAVGLSATGRLGQVPDDNRFWFAKLYEDITYFEILESHAFRYPDFVLHFIPVFYDLYYEALMADLKGQSSKVSPHWRDCFKVASVRGSDSSYLGYMDEITRNIIAGVSAHINCDMEEALVRAYESYVSKYRRPKQFDLHRPDFFVYNRPIFERVKAEYFIDLARTTFPGSVEFGQFVMGASSELGLDKLVLGDSLNVDEIYEWRGQAWERARVRIGR